MAALAAAKACPLVVGTIITSVSLHFEIREVDLPAHDPRGHVSDVRTHGVGVATQQRQGILRRHEQLRQQPLIR